MKKPVKYQHYIAVGLTILAVVVCSLLLFFIIFRFDGFKGGIAQVIKSLMPVVYGIVIAYLLSPLCNFLERIFLAMFPRRIKSKSAVRKLSNGLSITISMAFGIFIVVGLLILVIPQVVSSVQGLVNSSQEFMATASEWLEGLFASNHELEATVLGYYDKIVEGLQSWLDNSLMPNMDSILTNVSNGVLSVLIFFKDLIIGLVVAVYLLFSRKLLVSQMKKTLYAVFPLKPANIIMEECQFAHKQFTNFISGNVLDSLLVGVITFIAAVIMQLPYAMLIAVVIGVTNIIPFFGPFIGGIPCALIVLLVDPLKCLYLIVFMLILQQVEGNIIKPKILGQTSGLSSFWVLFSILLFEGMFGLVGMLISVPVFAVIYDIVSKLLAYLLKKRSLPVESDFYDGIGHIDRPNVSPAEQATPDTDASTPEGSAEMSSSLDKNIHETVDT